MLLLFSSRYQYKMNEIGNKYLLTGDKFMPEKHLKQPGLTYSSCGPFTKNKERIQKFMKTINTNYIYKKIWRKLVLSMIWFMVNMKI